MAGFCAEGFICLCNSVRGGLWYLRLAAIKQLAPLFAGFDRPHYQKLIPQHLRDVAYMPLSVINFLESGASVGSIAGSYMTQPRLEVLKEMMQRTFPNRWDLYVNHSTPPTLFEYLSEYPLLKKTLYVSYMHEPQNCQWTCTLFVHDYRLARTWH